MFLRSDHSMEPTEQQQLNILLYELPANSHIYPQFSILSIPIPSKITSSASPFRHMLVITEVHLPPRERERERERVESSTASVTSIAETAFPTDSVAAIHTTAPIVRTHYFYSTTHVTFTEFHDIRQFISEIKQSLRSGQLVMACPWVTQALHTPAQVRNYQDFVATYLEDHVDKTDNSAFWEALYGVYEDANNDETHRLYDAPLFAPRDFSTDQTNLHFMRPVPFAQETSPLPPTAAEDTQYSTVVQDGVFGPTGVLQLAVIGKRAPHFGRQVLFASQGSDANPIAFRTGSLGIAHAAFWGLGLLCENINFINGLHKNSHKDVDTWLRGASIFSDNLAYIGWLHSGVTRTFGTGVLGTFGDLGVSVFNSILDARAIYKTTRKKADMAQCLTRLEDFFAAGQEAAQTGQLRQALKDDHYQWSAEIASLYVMVSWLSRKYQRCLTGKKFASLPYNLTQCGLWTAMMVVFIAGSVSTYGALLATGIALGTFYFVSTSIVGYKRYANNCTAYQDYQTLIQQLRTEGRITTEEYEQEQWLFALASRLHPYRHKLKGATMGDYFRCKIASFVIIGKQKFQELRTDATLHERAQLILLCVDTLGDAIGYSESKHGHYISQGDLGAKTLNLANSIPIRGY